MPSARTITPDPTELDFLDIMADTCAQAFERIEASAVARRQTARLEFKLVDEGADPEQGMGTREGNAGAAGVGHDGQADLVHRNDGDHGKDQTGQQGADRHDQAREVDL